MENAIVVYRDKPKTNSWARWLVRRTMKKNQNNLVGIIGKTGSGKTWSAISICEIMSKLDGVPFGINNIVFDLKELMDLINSGELKKGSKIIFDEPQISISAKDFQSKANKVFNYLVTTFRHRNLTLFFCTPFESLLDKTTRKLFHARFETMSINRNTKTCKLKPRYLEYSDWKSQPYQKKLIVFFQNKAGKSYHRKMFSWDVPKPSEELINQYEEKKLEFTNRLNKNISFELEKFEKKNKIIEGKSNQRPLTEKQEEFMKLLLNHNIEGACKILNRNMSRGYGIKKECEKKGIIFKPIWKDNRIIGHDIDGFSEKSDANSNEPRN